MRKAAVAFLFLTLSLNIYAAEISALLYSFSPLAQIYLKHLGLHDRNNNGVIDKDSGEGYEEFIAKYGNADTGFHANGVIYGADNGKLEEPEIINYYYLHIRFKPEFERETTAIENEVKAYIHANNLPLLWLDDEQGTVMNAVTVVLGEGWNEQEVTEDEAISMFNRVMRGMYIIGLKGEPSKNGGYKTLAEFVTQKRGFCVETAQFGFWFFSELKINAVCAHAFLTSSMSHMLVKLPSEKLVDFFGSSNRYRVPKDTWHIANPLQSIGIYDRIQGNALTDQAMYEQAFLYDKYDTGNLGKLMSFYHNNSARYYANTNIILGEFFLQNNDIDKIVNTRQLSSSLLKTQVKLILIMTLVSYSLTDNKTGTDRIAALLQKYYPRDSEVKDYLNKYKL